VASTSLTQAASYIWLTGFSWDSTTFRYVTIDQYITGSSPNWTLTANLYSPSPYNTSDRSFTFYYAYI
jgi:hypothetical protein